MRPTQVTQTIALAHSINQALMIWGPPGSSKSSLVHQYAKSVGLQVLDWRLTMMDAVDMRGTPREKNGKTYWAPPIELPTDPKSKGILFLDELAQARVEVKNVAAMLILERRIGEYKLPDGWWVVAASNRIGDNAGTSSMPTHVNNRFWHVELEVSHEDWLAWAVENDVDYRVVAYLKYRPSALLVFDPRSKESAFATPRSWVMLSNMLKQLDSAVDTTDPVLMGAWAAGIVGNAHGKEFAGFLRTLASLCSIEQILLSPDSIAVPTDPSVCYALATGLAPQVKRETIGNAFKFMTRISKEFAFVFAKKVETIQPALRKTKAFVEFCATNADYI